MTHRINMAKSAWVPTRTRTSADQLLEEFFATVEKAPATALPEEMQQQWLQSLTTLTTALKIEQPELVARQLLFIATEARNRSLQLPGSRALEHAHTAAKALLAVQKRKRLAGNGHVYAMAASFFLIFGVSMLFTSHAPIPREATDTVSLNEAAEIHAPVFVNSNPKRLAEMHSHREKMRQGTCNFPEALMLAEADRGIYLKTVVYGDIPQDIKEQQITARLMESVRCDYTPMLMKNSIG